VRLHVIDFRNLNVMTAVASGMENSVHVRLLVTRSRNGMSVLRPGANGTLPHAQRHVMFSQQLQIAHPDAHGILRPPRARRVASSSHRRPSVLRRVALGMVRLAWIRRKWLVS
jgi:hypothetical protein